MFLSFLVNICICDLPNYSYRIESIGFALEYVKEIYEIVTITIIKANKTERINSSGEKLILYTNDFSHTFMA